jgi:hypothetical protein
MLLTILISAAVVFVFFYFVNKKQESKFKEATRTTSEIESEPNFHKTQEELEEPLKQIVIEAPIEQIVAVKKKSTKKESTKKKATKKNTGK